MCLLADYNELMIYASEVYVSALIGQPQIPRQPCHWLLLLIGRDYVGVSRDDEYSLKRLWEYQETRNTD